MSSIAFRHTDDDKRAAAEALAAGASLTEAARAITAHRMTVWRWKSTGDPVFLEAFEAAIQARAMEVAIRCAGATEKAVDVIMAAMEEGNDKAALTMLEKTGALRAAGRLFGMEAESEGSGTGVTVVLHTDQGRQPAVHEARIEEPQSIEEREE